MASLTDGEKSIELPQSSPTTSSSPVETGNESECFGTTSSAIPVGASEDENGAATRYSKTQISFIMIMLFFSIFLAALDTTITTTALPTITSHFNSSAGYTWVGSSYLLAMAASTPSWGSLSNIWGRKPALLSALAIFFLGSLLAGLSTTMTMLIAARAVQGTGGGGILILVNICTNDLFSIRTRGFVYGMESLVWATAAGVGPVLGGVFSEYINWRWCFLIAVPCSFTAFAALALFLRLDFPSVSLVAGLLAIDWVGSVTIVGATLTLLLGLEFGGVIFAWSSAKVLCLIISGLVIACAFLFNEAKFARYPVMPLRLFRSWPNVATLVVVFLHALTYFSATYYIPLYAQAVLGSSPLKSGLFVIPFEISLSMSASLSGISIRVTGRYLEQIRLGLVLITLGFGLFIHLDTSSTTVAAILYQIVAGMGTGLCYPGPLIALQAQSPSEDHATAVATAVFLRNLAAAISVVIGGVIFQNGMESQASGLEQKLGQAIASKFSGKQAAANVLSLNSLDAGQRALIRTAYAASLRKVWIVFTCTAVTALIASLFMGRTAWSEVHQRPVLGVVRRESNVEQDPESKAPS